nr:putative secreted protein [Rachicladosporium sp. CCFEE 5018]
MGITTNFCILLAAGSAIAAPVLQRRGNLPEPVSASTALSYLSSITVAAESNSPAYSRDYFPTWITISGACNTREYVLKRDGVSVQTDSACTATSGTWYSDYDQATWYAASDVDIDHIVPLKEAWVSGARSWTTAQRQAFANDVTRPQLLSVTDNVNQSKGDQDVADWLPPNVGYQCEYVRAFVQVKYYYKLSMDSAENAAAADVLNNVC